MAIPGHNEAYRGTSARPPKLGIKLGLVRFARNGVG